MSIWLWGLGAPLVQNGWQPGDGMLLVFLLFGATMLAMLFRLGIRGLSRIVGRSEIELRGDTLRGLDCWGPLRWGWRRPIVGLVRFAVRDALPDERPGRVYEVPTAAVEYNALTAVWGNDELLLARGYPRTWLVPIAHELARRCRLAPNEPAIAVTEESLPNSAGFVDLPDQPDDSRVFVDRTDGELILTLPHKPFGPRRATLIVRGDRLRVSEEQEWSRRQLADIRVARLIDSEGPDMFQVHIDPHPGEGKRVRLAPGTEAEARWLATTLRRALGMTDEGLPTFLERPDRPAGCPIVEESLAGGVRFLVPPAGFRHADVRRYFLYALGYLAVGLGVGGFLAFIGDDAGDMIGGVLPFIWLVPAVMGLGAFGGVEEAVRRARRHATLSVVGDTLVVRETNLYGTREREWPRRRIVDVCLGDTLAGRAINPRTRRAVLDRADPTWELHIHLTDGEVVRLFDGYGDADLQWLATALRRTLGVPAG
ncbi:MAG TPA: hypothetical protein VHR66_27680 [Gemmataceae bacterium]|jgi:hypothetical protein|nr:hypothetical protein [Gemmataceae bacterium]